MITTKYSAIFTETHYLKKKSKVKKYLTRSKAFYNTISTV